MNDTEIPSPSSCSRVILRQGTKYGPEYVGLLKTMIPGVLVMGDQEDADYQLKYPWTGWWAKMELFSPQFPHRPCVFFDLDTYILGNIDELYKPIDRLEMLRDFNHPDRGQSSIMRIPEDVSDIWKEWTKDPYGHINANHGDQEFLARFPMGFIQDWFDGIYSYKIDQLYEAPKGRIVCFHGRPRPHETEGWAGEIWKRMS